MSEIQSGCSGVRSVEAAATTTPVARSLGDLPLRGLLTNRLLSALPAEDFARLLPDLEPVSLFPGKELYSFGEPISFAYFPENVVISQLHTLADGSMTETAVVGKEGLIGLSAMLSSQLPGHLTQVLIGGSALRVKIEVLRKEFARGGPFQRLLLGYARDRLMQVSQKAVCNGRHMVEERFCCWLLAVQDRAGDGAALQITQEQIARHLGARRAGVTAVASALRERGIIAYRRGSIRILDREVLEAAACECYKTFRSLLDEDCGT